MESSLCAMPKSKATQNQIEPDVEDASHYAVLREDGTLGKDGDVPCDSGERWGSLCCWFTVVVLLGCSVVDIWLIANEISKDF